MFMVQHTLLSEDIAFAKFSCDIQRCKGACCVVGDAGAPIARSEVGHLKKAYELLKDELVEESLQTVETKGLIQGDSKSGLELSCISSGECVFVRYTPEGVATCAIQNAYYQGRTDWEKPLSCHLYPLRIKRVSDIEWINYEYIPTLCSAACDKAEREGIYLADFLEQPLIRRYGSEWYEEFQAACKHLRAMKAKKEEKSVEIIPENNVTSEKESSKFSEESNRHGSTISQQKSKGT